MMYKGYVESLVMISSSSSIFVLCYLIQYCIESHNSVFCNTDHGYEKYLVAIYDLLNTLSGHHRDDIIDKARLDRFLKLFQHSNVLPSLLSLKEGKSTSITYFDVYCDHILDTICEHGWSGKQKYFDTFALKKWEKMSVADRKKHTVSKCYACSMQYTEIQRSFPLKPFLKPFFEASIVAKQFNITTTNGGHMVKQLVVRSGLNVESLQSKKDNISPRNRVHKKRTSDSKVPVPCMPSLAKLKQEVSDLIDNGTLYLGEHCAPYNLLL